MKYQNLLVFAEGPIATITINRPKQLNALNMETIKELHHIFSELNASTEIRVIILTGSGEKAFVAGADIKEFADFNEEEGRKLSQQGHELLFNYIENLQKPVIAAINGFALGGGLELAMASHIRIASNNAKMGLPEVSLGVIPGYGGTQRLQQLIGKGRAMEMIFTANMITADEALQYGLVNYVVPQEELLELAFKLANKISQNSSSAIGLAIEAINATQQFDVDGYAVEIQNFGTSFGTEDFKEGTTAFLNKKKPNFL